QHDNSFCSGCHVMAPAWQKFQTTRHAKLSCHQCHQQSLFASARQLVLWVADRPGQIPAHSKVPNERCIACHVQGDSARWKQIAATEGHRLHLESPRLQGLQCVRCHGFSVHQFVPTDMTCGQAGCHVNIRIRLGKMSNVTTLHCAMCHVFTRRAAAPTSVTDSLRRWLTPTRTECFSCHAMRKLMVDQQLAHDPHGAVCGACHNPHTQTQAVQAERSCTNAGCHGRPETLTPAHRGLPAPALASCVSCHKPHSWKTAGKGDCALCHGTMFTPGSPGKTAAMPWGRLYARLVASMHAARPLALNASASPGPTRRYARWRLPQQPSDTPPARRLPAQPPRPNAPAPRSGPVPAPLPAPGAATVTSGPFRGFSHGIHHTVACTRCHGMSSAHGTLLVRSVQDCMRCHHSPAQRIACGSCHARSTLPQNVQRTLTVSTSVAPTPSTRTLPFSHAAHAQVACRSCHSGPPRYLTLASCTSCHESHHTTARDCRVCHTAPLIARHNAVAHVTCAGAGCHRDPAVNALTWSRQVCLACHRDKANHHPGAACELCHAVPALQRAAAGRTGG
ncbi:MAG TPA: cytochrome c3 family protein, partial [Longimicrobiales bacterium]